MATHVSAVDDIVSEYQGLEAQLADPDLHNDAARARKVGKRFSELQPIIQTNDRLNAVTDDLEAAEEMAHEDQEFAAEAERLRSEKEELSDKLADLLAPRDPHDGDDIVIVRCGRRRSSPLRRRISADVPALRGQTRLRDRRSGRCAHGPRGN